MLMHPTCVPDDSDSGSMHNAQPIDHCLPSLLDTLSHHSVVLLQAPPGAGKTTRVPAALLDTDWRGDNRILVLEPRRMAARSAARFMARQRSERVGDTIGYRTREDTCVSAATRIEVVTEGVLTRIIQRNPALEGYAAVLFDEYHERSLQADLGLALCREVQQALRADLRIIVMSATLDTAPLARLLDDAPVITSEGRQHPVEVHHSAPPGDRSVVDWTALVVERLIRHESGSMLVFLPGLAEIRRVEAHLNRRLPPDVALQPLHGNLSAAAQDIAIAPPPNGTRKVVLATAIAETSLTIDGVRIVVDAGLQRQPRFDPNTGMSRLVTQRVSRAAADQRCGRAGRTQPGVCYRLWAAEEHPRLASHTSPEILDADLAPVVLELAHWGTRDPADLDWLDAPPDAHWNQAQDLLTALGALDTQGRITPHGKRMWDMALHPRLAHMVLVGRDLGLGRLAVELAVLLNERDLLAGTDRGADMDARLQALRGGLALPPDRRNRLQALRDQVSKLARGDDVTAVIPARASGRLLALAFPDRIGRRREGPEPRYLLSQGRGARIDPRDALSASSWLVAADLDGKGSEARIRLAAAVDVGDVLADAPHLLTSHEEQRWDEQRGTMVAQRETRLGSLVMHTTVEPVTDPEERQRGLLDAIRRRGIDALPWAPMDRQWRARVRRLHALWPNQWPAVDDESLMQTLDDWLGPYLGGLTTWSDLGKLTLREALAALVDPSAIGRIEALAPSHLVVPAGNRVPLDYLPENGPVLAVKLQALFGWADTPRIADGHIPVVCHLLSPARRPLAITNDLRSFWRDGYHQVRKEMRGRYPKHPWPDDPLAAAPTMATRKRH